MKGHRGYITKSNFPSNFSQTHWRKLSKSSLANLINEGKKAHKNEEKV